MLVKIVVFTLLSSGQFGMTVGYDNFSSIEECEKHVMERGGYELQSTYPNFHASLSNLYFFHVDGLGGQYLTCKEIHL